VFVFVVAVVFVSDVPVDVTVVDVTVVLVPVSAVLDVIVVDVLVNDDAVIVVLPDVMVLVVSVFVSVRPVPPPQRQHASVACLPKPELPDSSQKP
jgi:hypothetical protein